MEKKEGFSDPTKILREGNISLILESYHELFSDFDPRSYSERTISDDFLVECMKALKDKPTEEFELRLLMPKDKRNLNDELKIKKRLKEHFQKHITEKQQAVTNITRSGFGMAILGFVFMIVGAWIVFSHFLQGTFTAAILTVILEPSGWFFFWEGMRKALFIDEDEKKKKKDLEFYKKMARAQVYFLSY